MSANLQCDERLSNPSDLFRSDTPQLRPAKRKAKDELSANTKLARTATPILHSNVGSERGIETPSAKRKAEDALAIDPKITRTGTLILSSNVESVRSHDPITQLFPNRRPPDYELKLYTNARETRKSAKKWEQFSEIQGMQVKNSNPFFSFTPYAKAPILDVPVYQVIGTRRYQEDQWLISTKSEHVIKDIKEMKIFAIFDGHGGSSASKYCCRHFRETLEETLACFMQEDRLKEPAISNALKIACVKLDEKLRDAQSTSTHNAGTTFCAAVSIRGMLYLVNVGDSRAMSCHRGGYSFKQLSYDMKPSDALAIKSVFKRGGNLSSKVTNNQIDYRVSNNEHGRKSLAITRAFGNEHLRKKDGRKAVTARPKIVSIDPNEVTLNKMIVIASDGLWDELSCADVADAFMQKPRDLHITQFIQCLARYQSKRSKDNTTVMCLSLDEMQTCTIDQSSLSSS